LQKTQEEIEEARQIIDEQKIQLEEKEEEFNKLKTEVASLTKTFEGYITQKKVNEKLLKRTEVRDEILNSQRSPNDKSGLGYNSEVDRSIIGYTNGPGKSEFDKCGLSCNNEVGSSSLKGISEVRTQSHAQNSVKEESS